jgi:hypothetical protein
VFDRGGILQPGLNLIRNALGKPEPLMRALPVNFPTEKTRLRDEVDRRMAAIVKGRERTRVEKEAQRRLTDVLRRTKNNDGGGSTGRGGGGDYGGRSDMVRLHPADMDTLGRIIGREVIAGVGAGNYAAGRRAALYTRGG